MKYKAEEVKQMKSHMFKRDSWLKVKSKVKDKKCTQCKRFYQEIEDENIGLLVPFNSVNEHLCQECVEKYMALGVEDIYITSNKTKVDNDKLIKLILNAMELSERRKERTEKELKTYNTEKLEEKLKLETENKNMRDYIENINSSKWKLEEYLKTQYDVVMDKKYLKHESQIEEYFTGDGYDYFDCGQGYYEDSKVITICIGNKFYDVTIIAEIYSSKQDRGDRLYWVENIESVTYIEIEKPIEKIAKPYVYNFEVCLLDSEKVDFDKILKKYKITAM